MISVIISTNNEVRNNYLSKVFSAIKNQDTDYEIIVVDNGSTDETVKICKKYTKNIFSLENSNRAERLNEGLKHAKGDIILFHHPVSVLPQNTFSKITKSISNGALWGGYSHSFDSTNLLLRFTSWYSNNIRAKKKSILYLDHQIFVKADLLKELGAFPIVDIFEDTLFSYKLRKKSRAIVLKDKIITSPRRFTKRGIWKQAFLNQYLKIVFHFGFNHKHLNKVYEKKDGFNVNYKK